MFTRPHDDVFVSESALWLFLHHYFCILLPLPAGCFGIELLQQVEKEEAKVSNFFASFPPGQTKAICKIELCVQILHHLMEAGCSTS